MRAIRYIKSVPRYLTARLLGPRFPALFTSGLACLRYERGIPPPELPSPRWARVRPLLSGICGSDLASLTAEGSAYFSPLCSTPFVFGHEVVGEVTEAGREVEHVRIGDRVILQPPLTCRAREIEPPCPACAAGKESYCRGLRDGVVAPGLQTGFCSSTGGGWSEQLVGHRSQLHLAPPDMTDQEAILVEPYSCSLEAARKIAADAETVLVIGAGTMGVLTLAALRAHECPARIVAVAKHPHQQRLARRLGADEVVAPGGDFYPRMESILGARSFQPELGKPIFVGGADVTFDCVASSRTIDDALRLTTGGGKVVLVGMPGIPKGIDWTPVWFKELSIVGSYTATTEAFVQSIADVGRLKEELDGVVGATFPLEEYRRAIATALDTGRSGVIKTAFRP